MTDQIEKFLQKLNPKIRRKILFRIRAFLTNSHYSSDIKKLAGQINFYRLRIGNVRIIFKKTERGYEVHDIGFRGGIYK